MGAIILALNTCMVLAFLWLLAKPHLPAVTRLAGRGREACGCYWGTWLARVRMRAGKQELRERAQPVW